MQASNALRFFSLLISIAITISFLASCDTGPKHSKGPRYEYTAEDIKTINESEQLQKSEKLRVEAYGRNADKRNSEKIKALGFSSDFLKSTIYLNAFGQWTKYMSSAQYIGLILENKKIASIESISLNGNPGIHIKRTGQPGTGIIFRVEGQEAYPHAIIKNGRTMLIQESQQFSVGISLTHFTNEATLN
jgi:hypothetical protein